MCDTSLSSSWESAIEYIAMDTDVRPFLLALLDNLVTLGSSAEISVFPRV